MQPWTFQMVGKGLILTVVVGLVIWWVIRILRRSEQPGRLVFKWILTILVLAWIRWNVNPAVEPSFGQVIITLTGALILLATWRHNITNLVAKPFGALYDGGDVEIEPRPYYSVAEAKRKLGKYLEAVAEIRKQLEKFPNDFEGQMTLAGIQAENLNDLPGAELTINRLCAQRGHAPVNIAHALSTLADWHLKYQLDREAARADFQRIVDLLPDSDHAIIAAQRIAHLATNAQIAAAHDRQRPPVPEGIKNLGLLKSSAFPTLRQADTEGVAADYVKRLEEHPLDFDTREKLALIYADHYHRLDLATDQLRQLIDMPGQSAKKAAHWLNLLGDLQVRHGADYATVQQTLEEILNRFPNTPAADVARTRLSHLKLEFKGREKTVGIKMGTYEQNIGLKRSAVRPN